MGLREKEFRSMAGGDKHRVLTIHGWSEKGYVESLGGKGGGHLGAVGVGARYGSSSNHSGSWILERL